MVLESIVADACGLQIASMSVDVAAVVKPKLHQSNTTKQWQETLSVDAERAKRALDRNATFEAE